MPAQPSTLGPLFALLGAVGLLVQPACNSEPLSFEDDAPSQLSDAPDGCPQGDWRAIEGMPCDESSSALTCFKVDRCASSSDTYEDQSLNCFPNFRNNEQVPGDHWALAIDKGSCDASSVEVGADGCPTTTWSEAHGLPCTDPSVRCQVELGDPSCLTDDFSYLETVDCARGRWYWSFDESFCEDE
jgi:hypothetical protein